MCFCFYARNVFFHSFYCEPHWSSVQKTLLGKKVWNWTWDKPPMDCPAWGEACSEVVWVPFMQHLGCRLLLYITFPWFAASESEATWSFHRKDALAPALGQTTLKHCSDCKHRPLPQGLSLLLTKTSFVSKFQKSFTVRQEKVIKQQGK